MSKIDKVDILVVDDNLGNLLVIQSILENENINIITATTGEQALSLMLDYNFALVLLDVQIPKMDGFEIAKLMRGSERTAHIPIIFFTAINIEQYSIFEGYHVGAVDYLFKPVEPIILQSKVNVFIELFKQKIELQNQAKMLEEKIQELMELKEVNWKLENLTLIDSLTNIPNRRSFDRNLYMYWSNCLRKKMPISLIIIDIDFFKAYNDHYGHLQGDECLIQVAKCIQNTVKRSIDIAARYGGEEFGIILPETEEIGAMKVATLIKEEIEALAIPHAYSSVSDHITISLGIASLIPMEEEQLDELIIAADRAMYKAKKNGRNRIEIESILTEDF